MQEFIGGQSQEPLLVFVSGIAPTERDLSIHKGNKPVIGDRNAMGVGTEIAKHLIRPAERRLAVDHKVRRVKLANQTPEEFGQRQTAKQAMDLQLSGSMRLL
jgi:hypothetical protein